MDRRRFLSAVGAAGVAASAGCADRFFPPRRAFRVSETGFEADAYDSLSDVHASAANDTVELRLPWGLLNVSDPSQRRALGDPRDGELSTDRPFDGIDVAAAMYRPDADGAATTAPGPTNLTHAVPGRSGGRLRTATYSWPTWNDPGFRERRKRSYDIVAEAFGDRRV